MKRISCMLVGDKKVGKSSIAVRYTTNSFRPEITQRCQFQSTKINIDGTNYALGLVDTTDTNNTFCEKNIEKVDCFLVIYSITDKDTLLHLPVYLSKIFDIKKKVQKKANVVIVGNKSDETQRDVTYEEGFAFAESINCTFMETSAKDFTNINHLFDVAARECVEQLTETTSECPVM
ncbi:hypothetical protein EIN_175630 [Entamoeba invadens IP1]|uniref:hypothetical protein n=1 Tax=Entamoeba invadens IP1 TaxID=370355 RepID=UPI0002C3EA7D|nr:hypothetical protein EIN_175630 [Entamoeba invadens IP1]ELP93776.1 hypothetical protein EIN_175630 [Entamoeba invadens IP1]|eukprot:XP_004260547.1 hypothetical protein EIN_175630 [Entamoeba invadens IP1]